MVNDRVNDYGKHYGKPYIRNLLEVCKAAKPKYTTSSLHNFVFCSVDTKLGMYRECACYTKSRRWG